MPVATRLLDEWITFFRQYGDRLDQERYESYILDMHDGLRPPTTIHPDDDV